MRKQNVARVHLESESDLVAGAQAREVRSVHHEAPHERAEEAGPPRDQPDTRLPLDSAQMLTVAQASSLLQMSERQIWRWIGSGELAIHELGRAVRIARADLEAFLARRRRQKRNGGAGRVTARQ